MDAYQALGVQRDADQDEVKKAYRELALIHHPDRGGDPRVFALIAASGKVLTDAEERARYDAYLFQAEVEETIASMLEDAFVRGDRDPIKRLCASIDEIRQEHRESIPVMQRRVERLRCKIAKFEQCNKETKNTYARDFIVKKLTERIAEIQKMIDEAPRKIEIGTAMLTFLNDLKCPTERESFYEQSRSAYVKSSWV